MRKYTGWDGNSPGQRAGTEKLIDLIEYLSGNKLWKNGSWGVRSMRGKRNPSVHGTGRAFDISWRKMPNGKGCGDYEVAKVWMDFLVQYADELHIEAVFDYYPRPWGRGWKCDRNAWQVYSRKAFGGAPGGDWIHVEIAPDRADDGNFYEQAFKKIFDALGPDTIKKAAEAQAEPDPEPTHRAASPRYPGHPISRGHEHEHEVRIIQARVDAFVDGDFGPKTEAAVKEYQGSNRLYIDGIVGPKTWGSMFP